jgi:short-subunit dehydrogenase
MRLRHPIVVITGASSGIGRATALRLARRQASLILVSRRRHALDELAIECRARGGQAVVAIVADVTDSDALEAVAIRASTEFGRLDGWVNCAAVGVYGYLERVPPAEFRRVIDVNVMGCVYGARAALTPMITQRRGTIVNIASILAEVPQPYSAAYSISKAAVRALGGSLRAELRLRHLKRVHVVTILPPSIDTPFFAHAANHTGRRLLALPPVYPPEIVAKAVEASLRHPRRPERILGVLGRALVRRHRRHPQGVERQVALLTESLQLSTTTPAPDTKGTVFEADPASRGTVRGGWHGRAKASGRVVLAVAGLGAALAGAVAIGAVVVGAGVVAGADRGRKHS